MSDKAERSKLSNSFKLHLAVLLAFILFTSVYRGQVSSTEERIRIMFYNVENLFDTINSDLDDEEFLPDGVRRWNSYRYRKKLNNISKVIASSGTWLPPDIIGLCEVENGDVINDLVSHTILNSVDYQHIYASGADERGIGLALIYKSTFKLLSSEFMYPIYSTGDTLSTRPVLFARLADHNDTLGIVVAHWPSRRGGVSATDKLRKLVSDLIRERILDNYNSQKLIVMGDFNCEPDSDPIINMIKSSEKSENNPDYFNPSSSKSLMAYGSYKYQGRWLQYDQFILNGKVLHSKKGYKYVRNSFSIIKNDYMLCVDRAYRGMKPFSTFVGPQYKGGYSDHLPIVIELSSAN